MSADTVPADNTEHEVDEVVPEPIEALEQQEEPSQEPPKEERVPLSALQKERRKRQESEQELRWYKEQLMRQQQAQQMTQEPDDSDHEPVSRKELGNVKKQAVREVLEATWISQNPEKAADINDKLAEFLKQRPHLARAIEDAPNRYEEAWTLMDALTPKQKAALRPAPTVKKDAPGSTAALPKAHGMNQSVDVMSMSDADFNAWRQSQRKRR